MLYFKLNERCNVKNTEVFAHLPRGPYLCSNAVCSPLTTPTYRVYYNTVFPLVGHFVLLVFFMSCFNLQSTLVSTALAGTHARHLCLMVGPVGLVCRVANTGSLLCFLPVIHPALFIWLIFLSLCLLPDCSQKACITLTHWCCICIQQPLFMAGEQ